MQERMETIIKDYLEREYHNRDALPNLVISGLASEIDKHRWEIHTIVQEEYDREDIQTMAESNGYTLTKEEEDLALHRYKKVEDSNLDTLSYIIDGIIDERGEAR